MISHRVLASTALTMSHSTEDSLRRCSSIPWANSGDTDEWRLAITDRPQVVHPLRKSLSRNVSVADSLRVFGPLGI